MEETLIRKIRGGIMGMKNGTKTPAEIGPLLNKLKNINLPMYDELFNDYKSVLKDK